MNRLATLISAFGESNADQLQLIREMESEGSAAAAAFVAAVARDENAQDYVRVEALKALGVWEIDSTEVRQAVGESLLRTLEVSEETLVRSFASMALSQFFDTPGAFDALRAIVVNGQEDEDVRHNALASLEDHLGDGRVRELMTEFASLEGSIGAAARGRLSRERSR